MKNNKNISYLEKSAYYPKIPNNYIEIFKAIEIDDDYSRAKKLIDKIPPAKLLLFQMKIIYFSKVELSNEKYLETFINKYPNDVKILLFIQVAMEWVKCNKTDKFEYNIFKEKLILAFSLCSILKEYIEDFIYDEVFLVSQFKDLGLLPVARCLPGVYNSYMESQARKPDIKIDEFMSAIPEELDVMLIEKWIIGSITIPAIINYNNPRSLGKNLEGIRLVKQAQLINRILNVLYMSDKKNKIKILKNELSSFFKVKSVVPIIIKKWISLSRIIAKEYNYELKYFTNIFFNNLNVAEVEDKKLIVDDLQAEYSKLMDKYNQLLEENKILKKQAVESVFIDNVTKIYNHSYFFQFLNKEIQKSIRYEYPISILFIDIDFFHVFNETYGYVAGNSLLRKMAALINENLRESDIFARYNNDDLIILLPHTGLNNAQFVANKIKKVVENHKFQIENAGSKIGSTVSIGVSAIYPPFSYGEKDNIIKTARKALLVAKKKGGNRVEVVKI